MTTTTDPVFASKAVTVRTQAITASSSSAGDSVTHTAATSRVEISNRLSPKWPIEYRVGSAAWAEVGEGKSTWLDIDLSTTALKIRRSSNAPASVDVVLTFEGVPAGLTAGTGGADVGIFTESETAATQALVSGGGIVGFSNNALPVYLQIGDSNAARGFDSVQITSGNLIINSPGVGQCTLSTGFNLPAGMRVRLALGNSEAPAAYYGEKTVIARTSSTVFTFGTGETSHSAASTAAGTCQLLHRPTGQSVSTFVRAYLYGRATVVNSADGASQTSRNLATLPAALAANPTVRIVDLQTATNDVDAAIPAATILANIRAIGELVHNAGALFMVGLVYPKGSGDTDATKGALIREVNAGLLFYMRSGICVVPDVFSRLVDGSVSHSTAAARAEMMADDSHLTMSGAVASFHARRPILDSIFGINPRQGTPDPDITAGLQNLFTWGVFADITPATVTESSTTTTLSIEANPDGPGNVLVASIVFSGAGTCTMTFPSATSILTANKRFRERVRIGVRSTTAALRNVTAQHVFTSSYQVNPQMIGTNTSTNGATGAGYPTWEPMVFETTFTTPNSGVTSGSATPQVVVTSGSAGTAVVTIADWRCYDLGASA